MSRLILVALLGCAFTVAFSTVRVPHEAENGTTIGWRFVSKASADLCDGQWPKSTPTALKAAFQTELKDMKSEKSTSKEWDRDRELCGKDADIHDHLLAKKQMAQQNPCQLPPGNYTYTISTDFEITFGWVQNNLEWGVKHRHLANCRTVFAAGEFHVKASLERHFNLESGTFSSLWSNTQYKSELFTKLTKAFKAAGCAIGQHTSGALYKKVTPIRDEIELLCESQDFKEDPNRIEWPSKKKSICKDIACFPTDR